MIRIAHLADLHFRKERLSDITLALDAFESQAKDQRVDLIAIAGDIWDGAIQNTAGSAFPIFAERIRRLADIAPVVMIYGTPSHDTEGSLEIFRHIKSKYGITILQPGIAYMLAHKEISPSDTEKSNAGRLLVFGVPEPSKKWLMANAGAIGKEAAAEAAARALQNLFVGLAAIREQHSDLPCIVLYHGRVRGATFSNGQLSDDGIARDVLTSVGADYYALGDIHEPQEIQGYPHARYPGSLYPCNWGEEHRPAWNLVQILPSALQNYDTTNDDLFSDKEIHSYTTAIKRMYLPLPQQLKIRHIQGEDFHPDPQISGRKVWLEITCDRDQVVDTEWYLAELTIAGVVDGSQVTLNIRSSETVRAAEITEKTRLRDKVGIWAEASVNVTNDQILEKADELEAEAKRSGVVYPSAHIRLKKLILRGAIGIWKGQKKEEVVFDLENLDDGLIALVGVNGAGKTTLIENLHPWPQLLTRASKLQDHFFLRDSLRDLYFSDERTGIDYRALLQIDGKNKSGSVEYHLYQNAGNGFEPVPDINGRKDIYIEKIEELFGSLKLYLMSAFISQRPAKAALDLTGATHQEKKNLFAELAGIDYLEGYAEIAKTKAKSAEEQFVQNTARKDLLQDLIAGLPELTEKLRTGKKYIEDIGRDIGHATTGVQETKTVLDEAEVHRNKNVEIKRQIDENARTMAQLNTAIGSIENRIKEYRAAAQSRDEAQRHIEQGEGLNREKERITSERTALYEAHQRAITQWNNDTQTLRDSEKALRTQEKNLEGEIARLTSEVAVAESSRESLEGRLSRMEDSEKICPTCGQTLPAESLEKIEAEIQEIKRDIADLLEKQKEIADEIGIHQRALEEIRRQINAIPFPKEPKMPDTSEIERRLQTLNEDLAFIDIDAERRILQKALEAETRSEELTVQQNEKTATLEVLTESDKELRKNLDYDFLEKYEEAKRAFDDATMRLQELKERRAAYSSRVEELEQQVSDLKTKKQDLALLAEEIARLQIESGDWRLLERACSRDGIQALELDAVAPNIAVVANRILQAAYGSKFFIEFRTTRTSGTGSKVKELETFDIFVLDNEDGTEQDMDTLSGGESTWIKRAIYDAFGIVRARNTGIVFLTAIQDEADGALDPSAKEHYFRMLEEAHAESGRHQTIIITHSREIQEMIQQTIDITALEARKSEEVAA